MSSRKKTMEQARAMDVKACGDGAEDERDLDVQAEDAHEAGFKDGMHTASMLVDEVLHDMRVDLENADLDPIAETAAKLTIEAISRLWYERKGVL